MAESSTQSIVINGDRARIAEIICDYEAYPRWTQAIKAAEVIEEYEDGYPATVRFLVDHAVFHDEYTLHYDYSEDISRIEWNLVEPSKMQKAHRGSYDIADNGDGTCTVTYTLAVDLKMPMLGMFKRKAERAILDTALKELKKQVEAAA